MAGSKANAEPLDEPALFLAASKQSTPAWQQQTYDLNPIQAVEIKELAVKNGDEFLNEIEGLINKYSTIIKHSPKLLGRIEAIRKEKKRCKILIGFLGVTGCGKSSLINALLELIDLLPVDDEKACTAVCVQVAHNPRNDPARAYVAVVERICAADWRTDLEKLFQDVRDSASDKDRDDGTPDIERPARIKQALEKVRCVYPWIENQDGLRTHTVAELINHRSLQNVLGKTTRINCRELDEFAAAIRPYIDSSHSKERTGNGEPFAQWPLVKVVRLEVKSRILEHGVVLVDLPGSMDTNAARGAIAEEYQGKLSVTCIVAPTQRAASDKPAQDLLGKITQRTLQLDNRFSSQHLCFIVSKTDTSMTPERYTRTHPNVDQALSSTYEKSNENSAQKSQVEKSRLKLQKQQSLMKKQLANIGKEIKRIEAASKKAGAKPDGSKAGKKRKRGGDDEVSASSTPSKTDNELKSKLLSLQRKQTHARAQIDRAGSQLHRLECKMAEIEKTFAILSSQIYGACITNRNEVTQSEIRADYESVLKEVDYPGGDNPLQVFCVSAMVHAYFQQDLQHKALALGFPHVAASGIPELQQWLMESTVPTRERSAKAFLESLVSLELSMKPFTEDSSFEFKMENNQKEKIVEFFSNNFNELANSLRENNDRIIKEAKVQLRSGLWSALPSIERGAANVAVAVVKSWGSMHWSTHKVTNRENGEWKTRQGVECHWNDDLAGLFWDPLMKTWGSVIHGKLQGLRNVYDDATTHHIGQFANNITSEVFRICPEIREALQIWQESTIRTCVGIEEHSFTVFNGTIKNTSDESHRLVKPKIIDLWRPIYDMCSTESGPGHYKRNKDSHMNHVNRIGLSMYETISKTIQAPFERLWDVLPDEIAQGTQGGLDQIMEEFNQILDNHTLELDKDLQLVREKECAARLELRAEYQSKLAALKEAWGQKGNEEESPEEEELDKEAPEEEELDEEELDEEELDEEELDEEAPEEEEFEEEAPEEEELDEEAPEEEEFEEEELEDVIAVDKDALEDEVDDPDADAMLKTEDSDEDDGNEEEATAAH